MTGLAVFIVAIIVISMTAPWTHPDTKYWKLMLPIYSLLFCSIALSIYLYGGLEIIGLKWTSIFWVIPGLIPLVTVIEPGTVAKKKTIRLTRQINMVYKNLRPVIYNDSCVISRRTTDENMILVFNQNDPATDNTELQPTETRAPRYKMVASGT